MSKLGKKLVSGSFWAIMLIHIVVFTAIGLLTTRGWRLLVVFLCGAAVILSIKWALGVYSRRNPQHKWLRTLLSYLSISK